VQNGHLEVVKALLEVGERELVMLTADEETSCLRTSAQDGHLEVVKALLEVGGHELAGDADQGQWTQLPLHQCGEGASGCDDSAAGGRGTRAGDAD
jgi:hypothetical protein